MSFGKQVPDKSLLKEVNKKLMRTGTQTKVTATVNSGNVTLRGALQYENQRRILIRATKQVSGVGQVVDQMTLQPKKRVN